MIMKTGGYRLKSELTDLISKLTLEEKTGLMIIPEFQDIEGSKMQQHGNLIGSACTLFYYIEDT